MNRKSWFFAILIPFCLLFSTNTMADLVLADGGATGQWFNLQRNGEGIFVEIVDSGEGGRVIAISWFTYNQSGEQMWLTGMAEIGEDDTVTSVPVNITDGPIFGPDYDSDDLNLEFWGTIELRFQTCDQGNMAYISAGFGQGSIPLSRLTNVVNVNCTEPPPETETVTPGEYTGPDICVYVADDGLSITGVGSTCTGKHAFIANLEGERIGVIGTCAVNVICPGTYAIYPTNDEEPRPAFDCKDIDGQGSASGTFSEGRVSGFAFSRSDGEGCVAAWTANP